MRIGSFTPNTGNSLRPLANAGEIAPGSLIVSDVFLESDPSDPSAHGGSVVAGARSLGFRGPVLYQQAASQPLPELQSALRSLNLLSTPGLDAQQVAKAIATFALGPPLHMLQTGREEVERVSASNPTNSVLNLSSGTCKAQVSKMLYDQAASAWKGASVEAVQNGLIAAENFAQLYGLDSAALVDPDSAISGPQRRELQNALIASVDSAWSADPRIAQESARFSQSVSQLEAGRNSVVIAAGNEGLIKPRLEADGIGELRVPDDFEANVLDCADATVVGATIILDGEEGPARYTSGDQNIDIYASGDEVLGQEFDDRAGLGNAGTSIAAPRVSAVMAALHASHPALGSRDIEGLLSEELVSSPVAILDYGKARSLF